MPEFIRLKNKKTGAEFTASADIQIGDDVERLDGKEPLDPNGAPRLPKYKTSPGESAGGEAATDQVVVTEPSTPKAGKASTPKE